jgi:uncharacterized membrane protein (DUF485 family)
VEKWYLPITILPGICLLILSTANLAVSLNEEMEVLLNEASRFKQLINKKLEQLHLLTLSLTGLYISTALMVLSGLISLLHNISYSIGSNWALIILLLGVLFIFGSLVLLIIYAVKAVKIRHKHFEQCLIDNHSPSDRNSND